MKYRFSPLNPNSRLIEITVETLCPDGGVLELQLPAWRPGRYELANYAQHIHEWRVESESGKSLAAQKITKDRWQVKAAAGETVRMVYTYYAFVLDAGSTYLGEDQLYVNPVNCLMYDPNRMNEPCTLSLDLPDSYQVAVGWEPSSKNTYLFPDVHTLLDSPFIASASLQQVQFDCEGTHYTLWFQGECRPEAAQLERDFKAFTQAQVKAMGPLPVRNFQYLFQIKPVKAYHGVEHFRSTVILLGPGYAVFDRPMYDELLGVSSHELFHCWNVKAIRPKEMMPYDYSKENYTPLGYVAEGVTTYYGDHFLMRSQLYSDAKFLEILSSHYQRHVHNQGRFVRSVAESSHDTWLDGYKAGIPHRKLSIYSDGALLAFMADVQIQQATHGNASLDTVMQQMQALYGVTGTGYSEANYKQLLEEVSGQSYDSYFHELVWGTKGYTESFQSALDWLGLEVVPTEKQPYAAAVLGIKTLDDGQVKLLHPDAPAAKAGMAVDDRIIAVNGYTVNKDVRQWLDYFKDQELRLILERESRLKRIEIPLREGNESFFPDLKIRSKADPDATQKQAYTRWVNRL